MMFGINSFHQWCIFLCMYVGYTMYIFNRKSFSFVIPNVVKQDGLDTTSVGEILSSMALAYSIGKFISGMLADHFSPKWMFAGGLFFCGLANVTFSVADSQYFALLWFVNGLVQGPGWPACAILLRRWFSPIVFGTLWSILSTSMNVPASIGPLASAYFMDWNGGNWRAVLSICGIVSCSFAFVSLSILKDKPEDVGLTLAKLTGETVGNKTEVPKTEKVNVRPQTRGSTWGRILSSPYTYVISFGFLVSLSIKGVVTDWGSLYLIQKKNASQHMSSAYIGALELGGFVGSVLSGILSDRLVAVLGYTSKGNPRHIWVIACHVVLLVSMYALRVIVFDVSIQTALTSWIGFVIGFCLYGIISLVGVLAIENSSTDIAGTSHAFCALVGNVGLMLGGLPFSMVMEAFGWNQSLRVCELMIGLSIAAFVTSQFIECGIGNLKKQD